MFKKLTALVVGVFASLALVAGIMQGCGGGSGSGDNVSLCQSACDKALSCIPDAGTEAQQAATECKQRCATTVPTTHCSNEAEIVSAARACLQLACDAYQNCSVPACQTATGTGGNGGTSGGGGTGGSGGGWTCVETTDGCACSPGAGGGASSCAGAYTCCVSFTTSGVQGCTCGNASATDCTTVASGLMGTKVASCPP